MLVSSFTFMSKKGVSVQQQILSKVISIEQEVKRVRKIEKTIQSEEKKIENKEDLIKTEELRIEKILFKIGKFNFKRKHLLELIRGTAGAFLGVGLGKNLLSYSDLGVKLAWWNVLGILLFILIISALLIYKNEKGYVQKQGFSVIWKKLVFLYLVSLIVEICSLWLFGGLTGSAEVIFKTIIISSYTAMAGAVSFSLL